ncbi:hypothetical protein C8A05DRAFT_35891 [Staphylotrichum tortipilum]|uniref:Uncharacterized protein n=1 Tax=Staphylotrichum tortipilum TaxID=2831512 RepID=A0AAN6RRU4_9PEZI|nr:hypothetical protein C8A05DRAFT_35891 [Staphylotrichum longicolle]
MVELLLIFPLILLIFRIPLLLGLPLAHLIHSRPGTHRDSGQRRTDTRQQALFRLSYPQPVIFDFSRGRPQAFDVTVPAGSRWEAIPTFHLREESWIGLCTKAGISYVFQASIVWGSGSSIATPGSCFTQDVRSYLVWGNYGQMLPATVVVRADAQLYRTLCSVAQDAKLYFSLCSTPAWIRAVYEVTGWVPYYGGLVQQALVRAALYA